MGSRKLRLTPLQASIVRSLEEAGAETINTVVATVRPESLWEFEQAVLPLLHAGLVECYRSEPGVPYLRVDIQAFQALLPLANHLRIDPETAAVPWIPGKEVNPDEFEGFMLPDAQSVDS